MFKYTSGNNKVQHAVCGVTGTFHQCMFGQHAVHGWLFCGCRVTFGEENRHHVSVTNAGFAIPQSKTSFILFSTTVNCELISLLF